MAKKDEKPSDWIDVTDTDGNTTRVTAGSFERLWSKRGYKRATKASDTSKSPQ